MIKSLDVGRDIVNQLAQINEVVTFGPGIFTGSATASGEVNIKRFNHWVSGSNSGSFYHALYNQQVTASLSTELLDVTFGYSHSSSFFSASAVDTGHTNADEKNRVYRLFAKQLLGDDQALFSIDSIERNELIFVAVRRSQYKDEIKKGTVGVLMVNSGSRDDAEDNQIFDDLAAISTFERSDRGDVGLLKSGSLVGGQVYYQAGICAIIPEVMSNTSSIVTNLGNEWSGTLGYETLVSGAAGTGTFDNLLDAVRYRFQNVSIVNQANLHSSFYFCRALNDEFNYSSNPTFLDSSGRIIPTSGSTDLGTRTFITKVGLLGENGEVLAVASLSQPVKKSPDTEFSVKVRLDY